MRRFDDSEGPRVVGPSDGAFVQPRVSSSEARLATKTYAVEEGLHRVGGGGAARDGLHRSNIRRSSSFNWLSGLSP